MDIVNTLLSMMGSDQINQVSQQNQLDPQQTKSSFDQLIPVILQGIIKSNQTPEQINSLDQALNQHGAELSDLNKIDLEDGIKILGHLFGNKTDTIYQQAGQTLGINTNQSKGLLSYLAPLVMGLLSQTRQETGISTSNLLNLLGSQQSNNGGTMVNTILTGILDKDGDGSYMDDLLQMGIKKVMS